MINFCFSAAKKTKFFSLLAKQNFKTGFTLIEIIAVITVLSIVMALGVASFSDYSKRQQYMTEVSDVKRLIQEQKTRSVSSLSDTEYGLSFSSTTITLFTGSNYNPDNPENEAVDFLTLRATTSLSYSGVATTSVSFAKRTGEASATGTIELYPVNTDVSTTTISIHGSGLVE